MPAGAGAELEFSVVKAIRSIRGKILIAFLALASLGAAAGAYSISAIRSAADLVVETYDKPLMAISYSRSAMYNFAAMERTFYKFATEPPDGAGMTLEFELAIIGQALHSDLDVARERALSPDAGLLIDEVLDYVAAWRRDATAYWLDRSATNAETLEKTAQVTTTKIDRLIDFMAADGFQFRQRAIDITEDLAFINKMIVSLQIVVAVLIGHLLGMRIVRPLHYAVKVAVAIARGNLDLSIRRFGSHEADMMLRALDIMRKTLRSRFQHEVMARESAQGRLVEAIEQIEDGITLVDLHGKIAATNARMADLFPNAAIPFAIGTNLHEALKSAGLDGLPMLSIARTAMAKPSQDDKFAAARFAGEIQIADGRWLRASINRTLTGDLISVWSDITEAKKREDIFRQAQQEAEQANKAKSAFVANISHELRTPLNAVIGFAEIIEQEMMGPLGAPAYKEYAGHITESSRNLLAIVNDLIDLSRAEAGLLDVATTPVEIGAVVETCARKIRKTCEKRKHTFRVKIAPEIPTVNADPARLKQILDNLLSNAAKFTPQGGEIGIEARPTLDGGVEIAVKDTGIGMTPESITLALQPFRQVDEGLDRRENGIGLGLPLTNILVELLGGRMEIESALEKGTTITLRFPARRPGEQETVSRAAA